MLAIAAEQSVDEMNLEEDWCKSYLTRDHCEELGICIRIGLEQTPSHLDFSLVK